MHYNNTNSQVRTSTQHLYWIWLIHKTNLPNDTYLQCTENVRKWLGHQYDNRKLIPGYVILVLWLHFFEQKTLLTLLHDQYAQL